MRCITLLYVQVKRGPTFFFHQIWPRGVANERPQGILSEGSICLVIIYKGEECKVPKGVNYFKDQLSETTKPKSLKKLALARNSFRYDISSNKVNNSKLLHFKKELRFPLKLILYP